MKEPAKSNARPALLSRFDRECDAVLGNVALVSRRFVWSGEKPIVVDVARAPDLAGRGRAALAFAPQEETFADEREDSLLALPVLLEGLRTEPFGLLYADGCWSFVPHRTLLGAPVAMVRCLHRPGPTVLRATGEGEDAASGWSRLEPDGGLFSLQVAAGQIWSCLLQYDRSGSGMLLLLTEAEVVARAFVPEIGTPSEPLPSLLLEPPTSMEQLLAFETLEEQVRTLFASGGGGAARGWLLLARAAGVAAIPAPVAGAMAAWIPAEAAHLMVRLSQALVALQEAPNPDHPHWCHTAESLLADRELLAGCMTLAAGGLPPATTEGLIPLDEDARRTFRALPAWGASEASAWLLDMREALALRGESAWWLEARWSAL